MDDGGKPLNIKDPATARLARELARLRGRKITTVVREALTAELDRERRRAAPDIDREAIAKIQERFARLPVLDDRTAEEILGYDRNGLPN